MLDAAAFASNQPQQTSPVNSDLELLMIKPTAQQSAVHPSTKVGLAILDDLFFSSVETKEHTPVPGGVTMTSDSAMVQTPLFLFPSQRRLRVCLRFRRLPSALGDLCPLPPHVSRDCRLLAFAANLVFTLLWASSTGDPIHGHRYDLQPFCQRSKRRMAESSHAKSLCSSTKESKHMHDCSHNQRFVFTPTFLVEPSLPYLACLLIIFASERWLPDEDLAAKAGRWESRMLEHALALHCRAGRLGCPHFSQWNMRRLPRIHTSEQSWWLHHAKTSR
ncbi:uncharacterized protein UHOD_12244 [Ustilago sp. UG-2017b]|nr:uncharacterized protein UHOD_12244 [Ustilago sp. UG-2017b]